MKKREFRKKSVFILYLIGAIISGAIIFALGNESNLGTVLVGIITIFIEFAIYRGLIVNRMGSVEDYLMQLKGLNLNFFIVNILIYGIGVLIASLTVGSMIPLGALSIQGDFSKTALLSTGLGMLGLSLILAIIFMLITSYANFIVGDPRNDELGAIEALKKVFSTGISLLGKTFLSILKYIVLPMVVFIIIIAIVGALLLSSDSNLGSFIVITILSIIFGVAYVYFLVKFNGELSDHYLNLYGDYEKTYVDNYDDDSVRLTREVEIDPEKNNTFDSDDTDNYEN